MTLTLQPPTQPKPARPPSMGSEPQLSVSLMPTIFPLLAKVSANRELKQATTHVLKKKKMPQ